MDKHSYLSNASASVVDEMYTQYLQNPELVEIGWRKFFEGFEFARTNYETGGGISEDMHKEFKVLNLIDGYRGRGHLFTKTNPVRERRKYSPSLAVENFGLDASDLKTVFQAGIEIGIGPATLQEIVDHMEKTYCQSIGIEYRYIRDPEKMKWIQKKMDTITTTEALPLESQKHILRKLNQAVVFENFLHTRFPGQKRFSLEGAETLIPALDTLVEHGAELGIEEFMFGMSHRGRLSVLANIFDKTYKEIFSEFESMDYDDALFDGDVKYHLGFNSEKKTRGGKKVRMLLSPNPSHLEAVAPVIQGMARAKLDKFYDRNEDKIAPVVIHGDAAIAGQGLVYEMVQMAQLDGYRTGGTIHIVINNQVGFTTNYLDGRSSTYCTDVGKVTLCPVFHVNGDDVEALVETVKFAIEYRQLYHQDVFIDLLCYRKYGHNEGDEPMFTQPLLYKKIAKHPNPRQIYNDKLMASGAIGADLVKEMEQEFRDLLEGRLKEAREVTTAKVSSFLQSTWAEFRHAKPDDFDQSPETGVPLKTLKSIGKKIAEVPKDKKVFRKMEKILDQRAKMLEEDKLDWSMGELLAYGSILLEDKSVRLSGQDVERGTFSHRHAVVKIEDSEEEFEHLNQLNGKQGKFMVYNSLLSEYGVLGFDYGYAMVSPNMLTIWEAQFGDFFNGAQIIIDQFLSSAEDKWRSMNGLVVLLPHGYEGMGPEHSSGRMERFLTLCAQENMQVANCTTPANFFHILRRQLNRPFRKPLVIFTPKSLLRHPKCVSSIKELAKGRFQEIIDDALVSPKNVVAVTLCTGKLYYDLLAAREERGITDVALVRLEQLYPFPQKQLEKLLARYPNSENLIWAQEEPENMGAAYHMARMARHLPLKLVSRPASASPASGSAERFAARQASVINRVMKFSKMAPGANGAPKKPIKKATAKKAKAK